MIYTLEQRITYLYKNRLPGVSVTFILVTALYERDLKLALISTLVSILAYIIIANGVITDGEDTI